MSEEPVPYGYQDDHTGEGKEFCSCCGKHWQEHLGVQETCKLAMFHEGRADSLFKRVMLLQDAFKELHNEACTQEDEDTWSNIRKICDSIGFDHDAFDWK